MTHKQIRPTMLKKFGTLSVLGLAALSLMPQAARADNDGYNDGLRIAQANQRITIRGTVQTDGSGNVFTMRDTNGRNVTVYSRNEPKRLSRGDLVEASGFLDRRNNRFTADRVQVLRDNNGNNGGYNTLTRGVVTDEQRGPTGFVMRANNGRTYLVDTRNSNRPNLQRGQTVEVRGNFTGVSLIATSVRVIGGSNNGDNVITGRVARDYSGRDFELRADNGRSVTVRARREPIRLSRGDRVEVRGAMSNGVFQADTVRILRDNNNGNDGGNGSRVNFTATVRSGSNNNFTVRADNGRDYTVTNGNVSVGYGDRVKVVGFLNRGVVRAESVRVLDRNNGNNGNNGNNQGDFIRFDGRVREVRGGTLIVRDEGKDQDRLVITGNARAFNTGDRVRVEGYHRNGQVNATSVQRR